MTMLFNLNFRQQKQNSFSDCLRSNVELPLQCLPAQLELGRSEYLEPISQSSYGKWH